MKAGFQARSGRWLSAMVLGCALGSLTIPAAEPGSMLRILFLGDDGHHRPAERFKQLESSMAGRHVVLEYTRALNDLNSAKLAGYDCLLIYANHTKISPEQEKALLEFVE